MMTPTTKSIKSPSKLIVTLDRRNHRWGLTIDHSRHPRTWIYYVREELSAKKIITYVQNIIDIAGPVNQILTDDSEMLNSKELQEFFENTITPYRPIRELYATTHNVAPKEYPVNC